MQNWYQDRKCEKFLFYSEALIHTSLDFGVSQQNAKFLPASQTQGGGIGHIHATTAPSSGVGGLAMT